MSCKHEGVTHARYGFSVPVARPPITWPNEAAYGGSHIVERCVYCGALRDVLKNGEHIELGVWGPSEREREAAEKRAEHFRYHQGIRNALDEFSVEVLAYDHEGRRMHIKRGSNSQWHSVGVISEAAREDWSDQPRTGALYKALVALWDQARSDWLRQREKFWAAAIEARK